MELRRSINQIMEIHKLWISIIQLWITIFELWKSIINYGDPYIRLWISTNQIMEIHKLWGSINRIMEIHKSMLEIHNSFIEHIEIWKEVKLQESIIQLWRSITPCINYGSQIRILSITELSIIMAVCPLWHSIAMQTFQQILIASKKSLGKWVCGHDVTITTPFSHTRPRVQ